jgi:Mn-containing catalase
MFMHDPRLAFTVRVDNPDPVFAKLLQQAIGGVEGEMRVMNQYLFQAWGSRGPARYRDMLLNTGTEEIGHIEMLATAVAMNLEGAPTSTVEEAAKDPVIAARLGGTMPRHLISSGLAAMPVDSAGVPFTGAYVVATGNLAADMHANIAAEGGGRVLATRLYELTDDPGMKEMLAFLIARDTMHQNQWMAVLEELKDMGLPAPSDFPQEQENQEFSYTFLQHSSAPVPSDARWASGPSVDGKGQFRVEAAMPLGEEPTLAEAPPEMHSLVEPSDPETISQRLTERAKSLVA